MTVFCGPSIWRNINVRTMSAMMTAMMTSPTSERVIWAPIWNDALIGRSRSIMCTEFLKTDADVMVIIDDDIVFEPGDFWKIVEGARETRGIYGGAYVTRSTEPHITSRVLADGKEQLFAQTPERRPVEYQYLATGFWAVHRDVMEAMVGAEFVDAYGTHRMDLVELGADRPFYPMFQPFVCREEDGRLHYLSEDWAYCNRARQLGFRAWVDLSIILIHMGEYPYTVRDLKTLAEPGLPSTGVDTVEFNLTREGMGDPIIDTLVSDIAEFSEEDEGDIRRRLDYGITYLSQLWAKRGDMSEAAWYEQEDVGLAYILDLASWKLRGGGAPFELAAEFAGKDVLDVGAGIGTFALAASRAGANVTAYEPNPTQRLFMRWRAEKRGHDVDVTDSLHGSAQYDAVVCWHVFEHIEDPIPLLLRITDMLKPDGILISQSGFEDTSTPMHHAHPDWSGALRRHGFIADPTRLDVYRLAPVVEAVPA